MLCYSFMKSFHESISQTVKDGGLTVNIRYATELKALARTKIGLAPGIRSRARISGWKVRQGADDHT
jgi:hypothetical protein